MNEARYIDEFKAAVLNILQDSKFLHDGKDGNVRVPFCAVNVILISPDSIRVTRTISLTRLLRISARPSITAQTEL